MRGALNFKQWHTAKRSFQGLTRVLGAAALCAACGVDASGPSNTGPSNTAPAAAFTASCTLLACAFTDSSTDADGQIAAYDWDFGDGTPAATTKNAAHTYVAANMYAVSLTVTDDSGATNRVTKAIDVSAPPNAPPTANFTSSCTDLACSFTDLSSDGDGTLTGFHWDFGDGAEAATQNPTHAYASPGTYVVDLTVTDDGGATGRLSQQMTVTASQTGGQATIALSRTSFHFCYPPGGSFRVCALSGTLSITNAGSGTLRWEAKSDQSWLRVSPMSGMAPSPNVTVSVDSAAHPPIEIRGSITVSATGASNSPQTISVTFFRR
jgi:PKD repeat protein